MENGLRSNCTKVTYIGRCQLRGVRTTQNCICESFDDRPEDECRILSEKVKEAEEVAATVAREEKKKAENIKLRIAKAIIATGSDKGYLVGSKIFFASEAAIDWNIEVCHGRNEIEVMDRDTAEQFIKDFKVKYGERSHEFTEESR